MKLTKEDVITIAVAVVAFLLIRKFYKFFGGGTTAQSDPSKTEVDESKLTYPSNNYILWADTIEDLLTGDLTEDEAGVLSIFYLLRTTEDVTALIAAYGRRSGWLGIGSGTLWQHLGAYLSQDEKNELNEHFRNFSIEYRI